MNGGELYIGIDPDLYRNGVAVWESQNGILTLKNLSFWQLFDLLSTNRDRIVVVRIEASKANSDTGIFICQMCVYLKLYYIEVDNALKTLHERT